MFLKPVSCSSMHFAFYGAVGIVSFPLQQTKVGSDFGGHRHGLLATSNARR